MDSCTSTVPVSYTHLDVYKRQILFKDFPGQIFSVRKESPLIVGYGAGENFLASDIPALLLSLIHI